MKIKILSTPQSNRYADGGDLLGLNGVNQFNSGSSHEESPYNGIPVGINPNDGQPNLVEKGEVQYTFDDGDYIFSNRNAMGLDLINKYNLNKKFANHTPAYIAKKLQEESETRPFDPISSNTLNENMSRLKGAQEEYNQRKQQEEAAEIVNNMSDEEKMGLLQLAQQQNPEGMTGMEGLQYSMGGHLFATGSYLDSVGENAEAFKKYNKINNKTAPDGTRYREDKNGIVHIGNKVLSRQASTLFKKGGLDYVKKFDEARVKYGAQNISIATDGSYYKIKTNEGVIKNNSNGKSSAISKGAHVPNSVAQNWTPVGSSKNEQQKQQNSTSNNKSSEPNDQANSFMKEAGLTYKSEDKNGNRTYVTSDGEKVTLDTNGNITKSDGTSLGNISNNGVYTDASGKTYNNNSANTNKSNRSTSTPVTSNNNAKMWYDNNGNQDRTEGDLLIRDKNGNIDFNATYADNSDFSNRRNEIAAAIDAGDNRDDRQKAILDQYLYNINRANPNRQFTPEDLTRKNFDRWTSDGKAGGWHMLPTDAQINSRLGNEKVPIDVPDEQEIPEDDITATAPNTENENGDNDEQLPNLGFSPYTKAPILGSMLGLSSAMLKPVDYRLANDIDSASGNLHYYAPAFVGGYDRVRPESADRANNLAAAQYNNQMSVIRNTGDRNAQMAGIMALNNQYGNIFDQNIANTDARNIQDRQNVLNRANQIDQYNASAANQAMNLNANIDAQIAQNQIASAKAREDSRDARLDAIYGGINNLTNNIGTYGREMDNKLLTALYMDSLAKNEKTKATDALLGNFGSSKSNSIFDLFK